MKKLTPEQQKRLIRIFNSWGFPRRTNVELHAEQSSVNENGGLRIFHKRERYLNMKIFKSPERIKGEPIPPKRLDLLEAHRDMTHDDESR